MVKKYYIRIDENEPVDLASGVYFVIEEDSTSDSSEFYLVRKNEYEHLLSRFNVFENEVTTEVQGIVDAYLQGGRTLERTQSTYQIISQDGKNSITYTQLKQAMDKVDGNHNHTTNQVKNTAKLDNIGSNANELQSSINQKIDDKLQVINKNTIVKPVDITTSKNNPDYINSQNARNHLKIFENDIFVFVELEWGDAKASFNANGKNSDGINYYHNDILTDSGKTRGAGAIPERLRPRTSVSVMNSAPMSNEVSYGNSAVKVGNGLKITFNFDGTVDVVNVSPTTVNFSGTNGYQLACSVFWVKTSVLRGF